MDISRLGSVLTTRWGAATDTGPVRDSNQDRWLADPPLFAVADGMGGHADGAQAAQLAIDTLASTVSPDALGGRQADVADLDRAIAKAAGLIAGLAHRGDEHHDSTPLRGAPGTTLTGAMWATHLGRPHWLIFNVGDSRTYLVTDGQIRALTRDHTLENDTASLPMWGATRSMPRHVITRALGAGLPGLPIPDYVALPVGPDDSLVLCSDGVHGVVSDVDIATVIMQAPDPQAAANRLVDLAIAQGTRDNATAIVVRVEDMSPPWPPNQDQRAGARDIRVVRPPATATAPRMKPQEDL